MESRVRAFIFWPAALGPLYLAFSLSLSTSSTLIIYSGAQTRHALHNLYLQMAYTLCVYLQAYIAMFSARRFIWNFRSGVLMPRNCPM